MKTIISTAAIAVALCLFGCTEQDEVIPGEELVKIGSVADSARNLSLDLFSSEALKVGYNLLSFKLWANGAEVHDFTVTTLTPIMHMPDMSHAAPAEILHQKKAAVVFVMPGGPAVGEWELLVTVVHKDAEHEFVMPVDVAPSENRLATFVSDVDGAKIFVALVQPLEPEVGVNDFEIAVFRKASMMEWPPVEDFDFDLEPTMPSMDHGSPNNENPAHIQRGRYKGKVNFTMDGLWRLTLKASKDGVLHGEFHFDIEF